MTDLRQSVLIGDENRERAEWLERFLSDYYNAQARIGDTFDMLARMARESPGAIVFLTDTLPYSYDIPLVSANNNFLQLLGIDPLVRMVCVVTGKEAPVGGVRTQVCYIRLASDVPTREQ